MTFRSLLFKLSLICCIAGPVSGQESGATIAVGAGTTYIGGGGGDAGLAVDLAAGYELLLTPRLGLFGRVGIQRHDFSRTQIVLVDFDLDGMVATETGHRMQRTDATAAFGVRTYLGRVSLGGFVQWNQLLSAGVEGYRSVESDRDGVEGQQVTLFSGQVNDTVDGRDGQYRSYFDDEVSGHYGLEVQYIIGDRIALGLRASHTLGLTFLTVEAPDCDFQGNCGPPVVGEYSRIDHSRFAFQLIGQYRF